MEPPAKRPREAPKSWADYMLALPGDARFVVAQKLNLGEVWAMCQTSAEMSAWCERYDLYNKLFRHWYGADEWEKTRAFYTEAFGRVNPLWMLLGYWGAREVFVNQNAAQLYFPSTKVSLVFDSELGSMSVQMINISSISTTYREIITHPAFEHVINTYYNNIITLTVPYYYKKDTHMSIQLSKTPKGVHTARVLFYIVSYLALQAGFEFKFLDSDNYTGKTYSIRSAICATCARPAAQLCGGCQQTAYCSRACQSIDWRAHRCIHNHYARGDPYYVDNIETRTLGTRTQGPHVLYNDPAGHLQVATMAIPAGGKAARETHPKMTQFVRVEQGYGELELGGRVYALSDGEAAVVPAGVAHEVRNTGEKELKLYTLYAKDAADAFEHALE